MTAQPSRSYLAIASAIVIAGLLVSASLFIAVGGTTKTVTEVTADALIQTSTVTITVTAVSATTSNGSPCSAASPLPVLPDSTYLGYSWDVGYAGSWNATAVGITGNGTRALEQCYTGAGPGYVYTPDWSASGGTTLTVAAQKTDAGNGTLILAINGLTNSTSEQKGSVVVTSYLPVISPATNGTLLVNGTDLLRTYEINQNTVVDASCTGCDLVFNTGNGATLTLNLDGNMNSVYDGDGYLNLYINGDANNVTVTVPTTTLNVQIIGDGNNLSVVPLPP